MALRPQTSSKLCLQTCNKLNLNLKSVIDFKNYLKYWNLFTVFLSDKPTL